MKKDLLSIHDLSLYEFNYLLDLASSIKESPKKFQDRMQKKIVAIAPMDLAWPTRVSWETAILQMGGRIVQLDQTELAPENHTSSLMLGKILGSWLDSAILGSASFQFISSLANSTMIPIINAGSDFYDPVTVMSDFFTLRELRKNLADIELIYAGKNLALCRSVLFAAAKAGCRLTIAAPVVEKLEQELFSRANEDGRDTGFHLQSSTDPIAAVKGASVIYTDSVSLLAAADPQAVVFYCPPDVKTGITVPEKFTAPDSTFYDQIENRLHIQKAIMVLLLEDKK